MCTAISMTTKDHYFGRNLDLDRSYGEEVCVMPRCYPLRFRQAEDIKQHYAMVGMATVADNTPLFYDATNECGLSAAGLNFPGNAYYTSEKEGCDNVASFEFIPWILGRCKAVSEVKALLEHINISNVAYSEKLPPSPLHWVVDDAQCCIVVEARRDGLHVYDNPFRVLTNNPPFEFQISNLEKYNSLRTDNSEALQEDALPYASYSQGLGAVGLPGDVSSMSRFVRAEFGLKNSVCDFDEASSVGQFFHLLSSVEMLRGVCKTDEQTYDITCYSACVNVNRGLYYYTTYSNRRISCVDMNSTNLGSDTISRYPLLLRQDILYQNKQ